LSVSHVHTRSRVITLLAGALLLLAVGGAPVANGADALTGSVVVLGPTLLDGATGPEVTEAEALGLTVDVKTAEEWAAMSAADFAAYRAIILGDPRCDTATTRLAAAEANVDVWGPVVNGDVIVIGSDPTFHYGSNAGATAVVQKGIALAAGQEGKTGAYITLSCYYYNASAGTPVPVLSGLSDFGGFTIVGVGGYDDVHIVATAPALEGLTDGLLSNWGNSVHEAFDSWPADFLPFAIATQGTVYTSTDGVTGTPYIMTRGPSVRAITTITLEAPATGTLGTPVTLTATADIEGPVVGTTVTFTVTSGPSTGVLGTAVTDDTGVATLDYESSVAGADVIVASFVSGEVTYTSGPTIVTWAGAGAPTPLITVPPTSTVPAAPTGGTAPVTLLAATLAGLAFVALVAARRRATR
jgi:hypothetical protein